MGVCGYTLALVQGQRFDLAFRYKPGGVAQDLTGYEWAGNVRVQERLDADLLLDLTPFLTLNIVDPTLLELSVPATTTLALPKFGEAASWDIRLWPTGVPASAIVLIEGPSTLDLTVTP